MSFSLQTLEFPRLLTLIRRHAQTPMGDAILAGVEPFANRPDAERSLREVADTMLLNSDKQVTWSFSGLEDPADAVAVLKIRNATLEPQRMLQVARVCHQALFARASIAPEKEFASAVWELVENVPPSLMGVIENVRRKILPSGEIDDTASPELARIRREISSHRSRLTRSLESLMRSAGNAIQDELVTVRNDRFVIPVKADFRGRVAGVAHGFSSSGSTVFVEPLEAIEANNELQNLRGKEEREIANILAALSAELRDQLPAIETAVTAVARLDAVKAKVEFARKFNAVVPTLADSGTLELTDARHPLLEDNLRDTEHAIVPISLSLSQEQPVMIISGANAGGKTVVMKTAGLLSMMAVAGLPVPASSASIPFYRSVLADIGDHQSLAANLSTFSSHMSNIAAMMDNCVSPSLVLLDEVGTGTDPDEGSALGVAIVDHFRRRCEAQVIASTHYRGLKIYAANDPHVINASVEFDERTLQPTYRLLTGLAGASSGIEIARRFGIAEDVVASARRNLDVSAKAVEDYLQKLQNETTLAEDLRKALEEERDAVAQKYAVLDIEAGKKERERQRQFERELAAAVDAFDRQSKAFLKTVEDKALRNRLEKERDSRKAELNRNIAAKMRSGKEPAHVREADAVQTVEKPLAAGVRVLTTFGNVGVIEKIDRNVAEVLVGGMRLRQKVADLKAVAETEPAAAAGRGEKLKRSSETAGVTLDAGEAAAELNLIGRTTAEAEYDLDRFLDEAYMAGNRRVRIIHGFGTGALKNFVQHFLKHHELIKAFSFAGQDQGGHGATVAELDI